MSPSDGVGDASQAAAPLRVALYSISCASRAPLPALLCKDNREVLSAYKRSINTALLVCSHEPV